MRAASFPKAPDPVDLEMVQALFNTLDADCDERIGAADLWRFVRARGMEKDFPIEVLQAMVLEAASHGTSKQLTLLPAPVRDGGGGPAAAIDLDARRPTYARRDNGSQAAERAFAERNSRTTITNRDIAGATACRKCVGGSVARGGGGGGGGGESAIAVTRRTGGRRGPAAAAAAYAMATSSLGGGSGGDGAGSSSGMTFTTSVSMGSPGGGRGSAREAAPLPRAVPTHGAWEGARDRPGYKARPYRAHWLHLIAHTVSKGGARWRSDPSVEERRKGINYATAVPHPSEANAYLAPGEEGCWHDPEETRQRRRQALVDSYSTRPAETTALGALLANPSKFAHREQRTPAALGAPPGNALEAASRARAVGGPTLFQHPARPANRADALLKAQACEWPNRGRVDTKANTYRCFPEESAAAAQRRVPPRQYDPEAKLVQMKATKGRGRFDPDPNKNPF